ncbi:hypothetical protein Ava_3927 [Trichormus variabilis ATCC 29413]|uniref:Uncharacterized protein n=2 Tax=Anabaena variabilis TaxID=264691 RepID=Q3M654_TRIV2|nr:MULTISPECIES: hypothetical protein [Nostocaceae]ABA23532.1 hypothetical protein Ava_3927 [Trichormus variabilis ATCC 29413]MBC1215350.1 hypothetical protein [Trichormus variabilis ARAD]MBC1254226.1 hypothetical protein [Trichormus variabilis V5]MBC1302829.1 hypothetical protein [Trichormus variabilis N2B]MBC1310741.1 hypothetical protein [Trichormus variabilis PNB]
MKLERKTYKDGNLHPEAFNCLKLLPDSVTYHKYYTERHPFSIYSLSIQRVMLAFKAILDEVELAYTALFKATGHLDYQLNKLPDLQKELLHALQSHIDDCYRILKVIHPSIQVQEKYVESWLEKANHPAYKEFRNAVNGYRESFAPIVNKIKHNGGQLRSIMMYSRGRGVVARTVEENIQLFPHNARIVGYFLEGMQPNGRIGPDYEIHPDGKSAISFNCDLRYHFANMYRVGHHLRNAIARTVRHFHGIKLPRPVAVTSPTGQYDIESIAEQISKLPLLFFQNEFSKTTPDIKFYRGSSSATLTLETPGSRCMTWDGEVMIYCEIQLDGVSSEYQVPYR